MFSINSFYEILIKQLVFRVDKLTVCLAFRNFLNNEPGDIVVINEDDKYAPLWYLSNDEKYKTVIFFNDQEPFYTEVFDNIFKTDEQKLGVSDSLNDHYSGYFGLTVNSFLHDIDYFRHHLLIYTTSEKSNEQDVQLKSRNFYGWYFFAHGLIALDWFRNLKYLPAKHEFSKVFICFNNMISGKRNYRLTLVANLLEKKLDKFGFISVNKTNLKNIIKKEIFSENTLLSSKSKKQIFQQLYQTEHKLEIDRQNTTGELSAYDNLDVLASAFIHVVTETIFYENKLHLTEKIFKPIVARRPFILVGAAGNLQYLKSYGFRTFDQWIDESYDNETDPDLRINMIVSELEKLCKLSDSELKQIQDEMHDIVEHNFHHFFTKFKDIIVEEMVENFRRILIKHNAGKDKSFLYYLDYSLIDFEGIKKLLKS